VCWHDPFSREFDGEAAISWIDQRISEAAALLWLLPVVDVSFFWTVAD
jgi:hypothetical protein